MLKPVQASSPTLRDIIEGGFVYVDKTRYLYELVRYSKGIYFLARPRRFGKSLLVTTLADAFAGHHELFAGLYLETHWDWERRHPVLRLDFGEGILSTTALLDATVALQLTECAKLTA